MKNVHLTSTFGLLFALSMLIFSSCTKEQTIIPTDVNETTNADFLNLTKEIATNLQIENGVLIFDNLQDYHSTVIGLNRLTANDQLTWEQSLGFTSMQSLFNNIMNEEWHKGTAGHSQQYIDAINEGLIIEGEYGYDLNIFDPLYATVLNKDGFVKVNDKILQLTANALKIWENGDLQQLHILLETTHNTEDITIIPMSLEEVQLRDPSYWADNCMQEETDARLVTSATFYSDFENPNNLQFIFVKYRVIVKSLVKDAQGNWMYDKDAIYTIEGHSSSQFEYSDGASLFSDQVDEAYGQQGQGGFGILNGIEAGEHYLDDPYFWLQPTQLNVSDWILNSQFSTGQNLTCSINK